MIDGLIDILIFNCTIDDEYFSMTDNHNAILNLLIEQGLYPTNNADCYLRTKPSMSNCATYIANYSFEDDHLSDKAIIDHVTWLNIDDDYILDRDEDLEVIDCDTSD